jgi:hypothetical protein
MYRLEPNAFFFHMKGYKDRRGKEYAFIVAIATKRVLRDTEVTWNVS